MKYVLVALALVLPACRPAQSLTLHFVTSDAGDGGDPLTAVQRLEVRPESAGAPSASAPFAEGHHGSLDLAALLGAVPETLDVLGLSNGSVIAAGRTFPLARGATTASVYVGVPNAFAPTPTTRVDDPRYGFTTTAFAAGDAVLVAGGATARPAGAVVGLPALPDGSAITGALALYDATTGRWSAAGSDLDTRIFHAACAAGDGSDAVLLIGGFGSSGSDATTGPLADVVRVTRTSDGVQVALDGTLPVGLWGHTATTLGDGSGILIVGGYTDAAGTALSPNAYVYKPGAGVMTTIALPSARAFSVATDTHDGLNEVLVTGGIGAGGVLDDALLYQPRTQAFVPLSAGKGLYRVAMLSPRVGHSATLLADGHVLVTGGFDGTGTVSAPEVFDPAQPAFLAVDESQSARPSTARQNHQAVALADGSLLLFGGETAGAPPSPVALVEALAPAPGAPPIMHGDVAFPVTVSIVTMSLPRPGALGGGAALGDQSILYLTGAGSSGPDAGAALLVPCNGVCLTP